MPEVQVNGQTIYYFERPVPDSPLPPLVLIHGAGAHHLDWPPHVRRLKGLTVYAPDLPGHGQSSGEGRRTVDGYAFDILAYLEALHIERAILAGHSLGGAIAQQVALDAPESVAALILVASAPRLRVSPLLIDNALTNVERVVDFVSTYGYGPAVKDQLRQMGGHVIRQTPPIALLNDYLACDCFDIRDQVSALTMPVLLIASTQDHMVPERVARLLPESLPHAEVRWLNECGHMIPVECPAETARLMSEWLQNLQLKT